MVFSLLLLLLLLLLPSFMCTTTLYFVVLEIQSGERECAYTFRYVVDLSHCHFKLCAYVVDVYEMTLALSRIDRCCRHHRIVADDVCERTAADRRLRRLRAAMAGLLCGFGMSSHTATKDAVREAVADANRAMGGGADCISIAFVSSTVDRDADEVRRCFVSALPAGTPMHGLTSSGAVLTTAGARPGAVACLLLSSATGCFATAYSDTAEEGKGAAEAAQALHEEMDSPQAIIMSTVPGSEEGVIAALAARFPNVPVRCNTSLPAHAIWPSNRFVSHPNDAKANERST